MDIRKAELKDAEQLIKMSLNFAASSAYGSFVDPYRIGQLVGSFILDEDKLALICEGKGMLMAVCLPFVYGSALTATEMAWWVEPEYRKGGVGMALINAFQDWAKEKECKSISLTCLGDDVGQLYNKLGYQLSEQTYFKEI